MMADLFSKYKVVLGGDTLPNFDRDDVLSKLAKMFNSQPSSMEKLLNGSSTPLKKEYDQREAIRICEKIKKLGAACRVEEIDEASIQLLDEETLPLPSMSDSEIQQKYAKASGEIDYGASVDENSTQNVEFGRDKLMHLVMAYVDTNTEKYKYPFMKFGSPRKPVFKLTWHWPAFFFFFLWALYRKMWGWAAVNLVGGIGLVMLSSPGLLSIAWLFVWPLVANFLYFQKSVNGARLMMNQPDKKDVFFLNGGVSKPAVWAGIVLSFFLGIATSNYLSDKFMEKYGEHLQDVLPGSDTQIWGSGLSVGEPDPTDKQLVATSRMLSYLATSLKVLIVNQGQSGDGIALEKFEEEINQSKLKDGWGTPISLRKTVTEYQFISAGADSVIGSDDDIIQPLPRF